jgi:VWFA-related protein
MTTPVRTLAPGRWRLWGCLLALVAIPGLLSVTAAGQAPAGQQPRATFRSAIDLVTVNVVVRDKNGNAVRGLTRDDFAVYEDGRPQVITTFNFEELDRAPAVPEAIPTVLGSIGKAAPAPAPAAPAPAAPVPVVDVHGRRLIVMLFDTSSMQPEEIARALDSARDYVEHRLSAADVVAITTLSTSLQVEQDFTDDKQALLSAINRMSGVEGQGFEEQAAADADATPADTGFTADDSEFNVFNTDRRLEALKSIANALAGIEQKKSLIYFSSGMTQTGLDNRVAIRSVIDRAVRANMSIYAADMRGLQALPAGGAANQASTRGQSAFSGTSVSNRFDQMAASQDALSTLAEDTGGRAFFDQNDFKGVFDRVVADTAVYYMLGFTSTNREKDGRFRRLRVEVKRPGVRLEYRAGYYAARDFAHAGREDREQQLVEQMMSDLSVTDLPVYATSGYFRLKADRYFVPIWVVVPASRARFARAGDKEKATLDLFGVVRDEQNRPVGRFRDTVNLSVGASEGVQQKNVEYQTDFDLPPGVFRLKVVVRENQTGLMGSFETVVPVPNLDRDALKVSSVVLATQLQPARRNDRNPLVKNGQTLLANVARVIAPSQHIYFYYEVYDPAPAPAGATPAPAATPAGAGGAAAGGQASRPGAPGVRLLSNLVFFRGHTRVYETPLVEATNLTAPDRKAAAFELDVPATELKPGLYTCQVNVIDDAGGSFAFPRLALYVRKPVTGTQ